MTSLFTKIRNGEVPGEIVYKDEFCFALMNIAPRNPGHLLLIPHEEIDHWDDVPEKLSAHLYLKAQRLAKAIKEAFGSRRAGLIISGMDIPHLHLHIFPANVPEDYDLLQGAMATAEELKAAAEKIRRCLSVAAQ